MKRYRRICNTGSKNDCVNDGNVIALVCISKLITKNTRKGKKEENII
jgi:hypothetical protein